MVEPPEDDAPHPADRPNGAVRAVVSRWTDHDAERVYLGAVYLDATLLDRVPIPTWAYDHPAHQRIAASMHRIRKAGSEIDTVSLRADLIDAGEYSRVGDDALLDVTGYMPGTTEPASAAERILTLARHRAARTEIQLGLLALEQGRGAVPHLVAASSALTPPATTIVSVTDRAMALGIRGERMVTGLPTLDEATRGGPLSGRVIVVAGAPGAGKTTLAVQLARQYSIAGYPVAMLACDEDADGLLIRWGQGEGLAREDLERGIEGARTYLAEQLEPLRERLVLLDAPDGDATVEDAAARLTAIMRTMDRPGVLVVDSIQTAQAEGTDMADTPRARIDCVIRAIKIAARSGMLVIATSEMARGYYRGGGTDATSALASGKESGAIEYGAAIMLALRSVQGEPDLVDVAVPKNRLGRAMGDAPMLRLRLDRERALLEEVDLPDVDQDGLAPARRQDAARTTQEIADAIAIVTALRLARHPIIGTRTLGATIPGRQQRRLAAIALAQARGWIVGGGRKEPYTLTDSAPHGAPDRTWDP